MAVEEQQEYAGIYTEYRVMLFNYLLRLTGNPHDAEDIYQETFLRLYRLETKPSMLKGWLFKTAYRLFVDHWRKRKKQTAVALQDDSGQGMDHLRLKTDQAILKRETELDLEEALKALSDRERAALLLREREAATYKEIADILGCSENVVKTLIYRARSRLRRLMLESEKEDNTNV